MAFRTNKVPVLQEKSASGAVATFNTALAMPLASCNIAVNAWQEGSGTPSPSNPRPISGYSAINIANASEDLYHDITVEDGCLDTRGNVKASGVSSATDYIPVAEGLVYYYYDYATASLGPRNICIYDDNKQFVSYIAYETVNKKVYFSIPSNGAYVRITIDRNYTNQHLYNGTTTTIQIGSTVYGGEYDARTGECKSEFANDRLDSKTWSYNSGRVAFNVTFSGKDQSRFREMICSCYTNGGIIYSASEVADKPDKAFYMQPTSDSVFIKDSDYTDPTAWLNALGSNTLLYPLATPQTIQLPPCPIDTLEGVNNIFADTGDVDLTYKDLDIAKRGNFREVFRLPS